MSELAFPHRFFPPGNPAERITLLALHGTGGDENSLLEFAVTMYPGASVLAPRGPVSEGGASRWFRRFGEGVFDEADIRRRTPELATFVADACRAYDRNPEWVVAIGYSNGANMAAALMLLAPQTLRGALMYRAMLPVRPTEMPDLNGKDALVVSGNADPMGPLDSAASLVRILSESRARTRHEILPTGHGLITPDMDLGRLWLKGLV